jgi:hypothetical protein
VVNQGFLGRVGDDGEACRLARPLRPAGDRLVRVGVDEGDGRALGCEFGCEDAAVIRAALELPNTMVGMVMAFPVRSGPARNLIIESSVSNQLTAH